MSVNKVIVSTPGPAGEAGINFRGSWDSETNYYSRDLVRYSQDGNLYFCISTPPSAGELPTNTTYFSIFSSVNDVANWTSYPQYNTFTDSLGVSGYSAKHYVLQSKDWASRLTTQVRSDDDSTGVDYSSKEYAIGTSVPAGSSKEWATQEGSQEVATGLGYSSKAYAQDTLNDIGSAKDWATRTTGVVNSEDGSSKAYAIGGTGVTDTAGKGAAKEWATKTSSTVDTAEYSAKEYATGSQSSTGGSSKNWAQQTGGDVTGASVGSKSAKAWAVETGATAPADGSAKEWATVTGTTVAASEYSAKEYATGTTVTTGSSKDWAIKDGAAQVATTDYSAKAYAQDTLNDIGSSKDWAVKTTAQVSSTDYSSKEWAVGTQTRGTASGGSAKDWATYTGGTVDNAGYSAKYNAEAANDSKLTSQSYAVDTGAYTQTYSGGTGTPTTDYSSKEWAVGTTVPDGSSKDWATQMGSTVDGSEYSAKYYANQAAASFTSTENLFTQFGDQYLGSSATDPSADNSGNALTTGDIYWNTTDSVLKFYTGTAWVAPEDIATTAATNASNSAAAAATSESNAATSESNAATSESNAATSASNALTSESNAATSESNAANSASAAATSASNAAASLDQFDDRYLGVKTSDPSVDNDGDALVTGALYFNSTSGNLRVWDGSAWNAIESLPQGLGTTDSPTFAGLDVDNININGNAITSTDANGNIALTPNGTGEVDISKVDIDGGTIDGVTIGGSSAGAVTTTSLVATTADINGGTIDGTDITVGAGKTLDVSAGTLTTSAAQKTAIVDGGKGNLTASDVGLGNVTNESKATMFTNPTFTGTVSGVTKAHVGLGNVDNVSKATMFTNPAFTGNPTVNGGYVGWIVPNFVGANQYTTFRANKEANYPSGKNCVAIGNSSFRYGTGVENVGVGAKTGFRITTGTNNVLVGYYTGGNLTTGSNNVFIGNSAGYSLSTTSNTVILGNNSISSFQCKVALTVTSDIRDKNIKGGVSHGLDFVKQIHPIKFAFKKSREETEDHGQERYGFSAQEILELEGDDPIIVDNRDPENLLLVSDYLLPVLVNAIKEQQTIIESQQQQIDALTARLDAAGL